MDKWRHILQKACPQCSLSGSIRVLRQIGQDSSSRSPSRVSSEMFSKSIEQLSLWHPWLRASSAPINILWLTHGEPWQEEDDGA